jgi:hypothetical protein
MAKLEVFVVRAEGDAAAMAEAFELVRKQLGYDAPLPDRERDQGRGSLFSGSGRDSEQRTLSGASPHLPLSGGETSSKPKRQARQEAGDSGKSASAPSPRGGSFQSRALEIIRNSHYGVTSEELHKELGCATMQSAYQICLELEKKQLIERTGTGAWKALNG